MYYTDKHQLDESYWIVQILVTLMLCKRKDNATYLPVIVTEAWHWSVCFLLIQQIEN